MKKFFIMALSSVWLVVLFIAVTMMSFNLMTIRSDFSVMFGISLMICNFTATYYFVNKLIQYFKED